MLTIKPISNAKEAQHYYANKDNYYLTDKDSLKEASGWMGKGSEYLGLSGKIEPEEFLKLLNGELPNGQMLGIVKNGVRHHRAGTDVTLSAPKSVSILALVGEDKRLIEAHNKAVAVTFGCLEKLAAEARITFNKETGFEKTRNLVAASFIHTSSRELQPDLHTHLPILNMTRRSDGQWRALSSLSPNEKDLLDNGFRELIYDNQHYLGLVYTSTLAKETKNIGYDIRVKDQYGNFEIEGVSDDIIKDASKRRQDILNDMQQKGFNSAKAAEKSNLDTRKVKAEIDSASLIKRWKDDFSAKNIDLNKIIGQAKNNKCTGETVKSVMPQISEHASLAVKNALDHLSEYNTEIKHGTLVRKAFSFAAGFIAHNEIEDQISRLLDSHELLGKKDEYYTTKSLCLLEESFVKSFKRGAKNTFSIATEQTGLIKAVLNKSERIQIIDVNGLSNEKNLIQDFVSAADEVGVNPYILHIGKFHSERLGSPLTREPVKGMFGWIKSMFRDEVSHTVSGFITHFGETLGKGFMNKNKDNLVIVHDAQKLSYKVLEQLNEITNDGHSKLILLNNCESTQGFGAGNPIKVLKENGFKSTLSMTQRQHVSVSLTANQQNIKSLVSSYMKNRDTNTQVVALSNKKVDEANNAIREALKNECVISRQTKVISVLSTSGLTKPEKKYEKFYDIGDRVTINAFTKEQQHFRVIKDNQVKALIDSNGKRHNLDVNKAEQYTISKQKQMEISIGEQLITDRAFFHQRRKIDKGTELTVTQIDKDGVFLKIDNNSIYLENEKLAEQYFSYAYCKKVSALNKNTESVMLLAESYRLNANVIGEISEYSKKISIFTDDKNKAENALDKAQVKWHAKDVSLNKPSLINRDLTSADKEIEKDINVLVESLKTDLKGKDRKEIANLAASYAVAKCAEREAAFKHSDLMMHALKYALGDIDFNDIAPVLAERMNQAGLLYMGTYWTTKEAIEMESAIVKNNLSEQGCMAPIEKDANKLLDIKGSLTQGQKDAATLILTSKDRFNSIQGLAGVGKTYMMTQVQDCAVSNGFKVIGLAPTHKAVEELNKNSINSITIDSFLQNNPQVDAKTLFIVDEASMISNAQYLALQNATIEGNARMTFSGDMTQLQSLRSGAPHELSIKTESQKTAYMTEIIRQNPNPSLKKAAEHASVRQIKEAFDLLREINPEDYIKRQTSDIQSQQSIVEIKPNNTDGNKDYSPIYEAISKDYLSRTVDCQKNTIVVVHAHQDRNILDAQIREGLKQQKQIAQTDFKVGRLFSVSMDKADMVSAKNYQNINMVRFGKSHGAAIKDEYLKIESVDEVNNKLNCISSDGLKLSIRTDIMIKAKASLYKQQVCPIAKGDRIRLKKSDIKRGHTANKEYEVIHVNGQTISLKNKDDVLVLKHTDKKDQHWDYAYTETAYSVQGATEKYVIALELTDRIKVTTHRAHEIDITRPSHQVTVYTDHLESLVKRLDDKKKQRDTDKKSAILTQIDSKEAKDKQNSIVAKINDSKRTPVESSIKNPTKPTFVTKKLDANHVQLALNNQCEAVARHLLGEPNQSLSNAKEYRYGKHGSLRIDLEKGLWHNFETSEGGNLFQLIESELGFSSFKETLDYAAKLTNFSPDIVPIIKMQKSSEKNKNGSTDQGRKDIALKLYNKSMPIKGSIVEKYLSVHRGLHLAENADIRYCPSVYSKVDGKNIYTPALLAFTRNDKGEVNNIQVTKLDVKTANKNKLFDNPKQTFGKMNGYAVNLNHKGEGDITYITEGVETGLSILQVNPKAKVFTVLGKENFSKINTSNLSKHVVICVDNDGKATYKLKKGQDTNVIIEAVERLQEAGKHVSISLSKKDGFDLNDILIKEGIKSLEKHLQSNISKEKYHKKCLELNNQNRNVVSKETIISKEISNSISKSEMLKSFKGANNYAKSNIISKLKNESYKSQIKPKDIDVGALRNHQRHLEKEL